MEAFTIYRYYSHPGHVTNIILINFPFLVSNKLTEKLLKMAKSVLRKACFTFDMLMTLVKG